jgi:hypothetical protein
MWEVSTIESEQVGYLRENIRLNATTVAVIDRISSHMSQWLVNCEYFERRAQEEVDKAAHISLTLISKRRSSPTSRCPASLTTVRVLLLSFVLSVFHNLYSASLTQQLLRVFFFASQNEACCMLNSFDDWWI